jgi:hypothetical protein
VQPGVVAALNSWADMGTIVASNEAKKVSLNIAEIQFGSHVHMLPMPKNYISEVSKNLNEKFYMYIFIIHMRS